MGEEWHPAAYVSSSLCLALASCLATACGVLIDLDPGEAVIPADANALEVAPSPVESLDPEDSSAEAEAAASSEVGSVPVAPPSAMSPTPATPATAMQVSPASTPTPVPLEPAPSMPTEPPKDAGDAVAPAHGNGNGNGSDKHEDAGSQGPS
jgi:hypothetical protein